MPKHVIASVEQAIKSPEAATFQQIKDSEDAPLTLRNGLSFGAVWTVHEVATKTNTVLCRKVPQPNEVQRKLLEALELKAPEKISLNEVNVVTHKKLPKQRKSA